MNNDIHPKLAREGWPFIALFAIVAIAVSVFWGIVSIPFWLLVIFALQFFRDPHRAVADEAGVVMAPADGKVIFTGPARDPYLDRDAVKVSIFMNVFNVHSNRAPISSEVVDCWYSKGSFVNAALDKASEQNERNALHLKTAEGVDITCVQVAGLVARRILCYVEKGAQLVTGQRYGFIRFGSRVDLYLPTDFVPKVVAGQKTRSGVTVIGRLG